MHDAITIAQNAPRAVSGLPTDLNRPFLGEAETIVFVGFEPLINRCEAKTGKVSSEEECDEALAWLAADKDGLVNTESQFLIQLVSKDFWDVAQLGPQAAREFLKDSPIKYEEHEEHADLPDWMPDDMVEYLVARWTSVPGAIKACLQEYIYAGINKLFVMY
jgi:hypothetical protein